MVLSPETRAQWAKFRSNRRAWVRLWLLAGLFLPSLPAELLLNDKPLVLRVDGQTYWPLFRAYTYRDFGGASPIPVRDYAGPLLGALLEGGNPTRLDPVRLYGPDQDEAVFDPGRSDEEVLAEWARAVAAVLGLVVWLIWSVTTAPTMTTGWCPGPLLRWLRFRSYCSCPGRKV